ncbi:MAG: ClpX C4-type zinc finger protein, partial [Myxococcales bacterium]
DCWCSFCCRPKAEAGPMIAGPAGAFICRGCIAASARLSGGEAPGAADVPSGSPRAPAAANGAAASPGFVRSAVALSKALGWSLSEIRSLTEQERAEALALLKPAAARKARGRGRRKS